MMEAGLIGRKEGMTRVFEADGSAVPVTVIAAGPCVVVRLKSQEKEGYRAVQLGFGPRRRNLIKPLEGQFRKSGLEPGGMLKEFRVSDEQEYAVGRELKADMFTPGDFVDVRGISKGKGFAGVMKRWGFGGGSASHGSSKWNRRPGSIGASATPARVLKGQKMSGRAGGEKVAVKNLKVVRVEAGKNIIMVRGAVPGHDGGYVFISRAGKKPAEK